MFGDFFKRFQGMLTVSRVKAFLKVRFSRVRELFCGGGLRPVLRAASSLNRLLEVKRRGDRGIGSTGARLGRKGGDGVDVYIGH